MAIYERDEYSEKHLAGPGFWFGLSWVIATVAAVVVGDALASWIQLLSGPTGFGGVVVAALVGLTVGLCMAVAQAIVLLPYLRTAGALQWIGATMLGRIVRMLVITLLSYTLLANIPTEAHGALFIGVIAVYFGAMALTGGAGGAAIGFAQRFVLEKQVAQPQRWVWINIISSAVVFIAIAATSFSTNEARPPIPDDGIDYFSVGGGSSYASPLDLGLAFDIVTGAVAAAITGFVLIDMLRHPTPQAEWSTRLKDEHERLPKDVTEAQPSPEALLKAQQRRGSE
jgi:hypothetical protein